MQGKSSTCIFLKLLHVNWKKFVMNYSGLFKPDINQRERVVVHVREDNNFVFPILYMINGFCQFQQIDIYVIFG